MSQRGAEAEAESEIAEPARGQSGITLRRESRDAASDLGSEASATGGERETTPAPPTAAAVALSEPSLFPGQVPVFDFGGAPSARLLPPGEASVPVRTSAKAPDALPHRLAFLLLVVDDRSSIAEIAAHACLPAADVVASFVDLQASGLVAFPGS